MTRSVDYDADAAQDALLVRAHADKLPLADATCDRVLCVNALHHFPAQETCIAELRRVLRPGGGAMIVGLDPHCGLDRWWIYDWFEGSRATDETRYPATATIRFMLARAGFSRGATVLAQRFKGTQSAHAMFEAGLLDKTFTSQLTALTDEEYAVGLERVRKAIAAARLRGEDLELTTNLRLWATTAWVE